MKTTKKVKRKSKIIRKDMMHYINPKTGNIVGYLRALQLHITRTAKAGILNPKTKRLISPYRAKLLKLI